MAPLCLSPALVEVAGAAVDYSRLSWRGRGRLYRRRGRWRRRRGMERERWQRWWRREKILGETGRQTCRRAKKWKGGIATLLW